MEKRFLTAIALSALILFGWQFIMMQFFPPPPAPVSQPAQPVAEAPAAPAEGAPTGVVQTPAPVDLPREPEREFLVKAEKWQARFSTRGGVPTSWQLLVGPDGEPLQAHDGGVLELVPQGRAEQMGLPLQVLAPSSADVQEPNSGRLNEIVYRAEVDGQPVGDTGVQLAPGQKAELTFSSVDPATGQPVVKRFALDGGRYDFTFSVEGTRTYLKIGPRIGDQSIKVEDTYSNVPPQIIVGTPNGDAHHYAGGSIKVGGVEKIDAGRVRWAGVGDSYFAMVATVGGPGTEVISTNAKAKLVENEEMEHDFVSVFVPLENGSPVHVFVGPKDKTILDDAAAAAGQIAGAPVDLEGLINYGYFGTIVKPIVWLIDWSLRLTHRFVPNYGWAIVLLTTLFNLVFFPLKYKSTVAMRRAAKMQPRMKELQERMKKVKFDDPEFKKLQSEQMQLMREGNPLGGCLPLLIQMPFFWAFFVYLTTSFLVRREPFFLWVQDLSSPDPYYLLPVLMVIAQIGATMIMPMPATDDPAMKMQRMLMTWVMPIVFAYFFLASAPSGLVLYWMTLNLVNVAIQLTINRMLPPEPVEPPSGPDGKKKKPKPATDPEGKLAVVK